jgi:hypothetical protein
MPCAEAKPPPLLKKSASELPPKIGLAPEEHQFVEESSIHRLFTTFCAIGAVAIVVHYAYAFERGSVAAYCA